jgi:predicted patatin/cPLA2 family phospholipase
MNELSHHFEGDPYKPRNIYREGEILEFHSQHFQEMAERHNQKWWNRIRITLRMSKEKDEIDIAQENAEAEKIDFEARQTEEFERWQEGLERVWDELRFVKEDPEGAEEAGVRPLLLIMGGGMCGPYCAGQVVGLHDVGFGEVFKNVVGFSAGSGPAAYFVAGAKQARNATSLFRDECTSDEFLSFGRLKVIDTGVIASTMREGEKSLDQEAIRESTTGLYAGVTNVETGEVEFVDLASATRDGEPDMVAVCEASSAIPLFESPFEVNGQMYLDGSLGELPFNNLIKQFKPTSILVLPNMPFSEIDTFEQASVESIALWAAKLLGSGVPLGAGPPTLPEEKSRLARAADSLQQTLGIRGSSGRTIKSIEHMVTRSVGSEVTPKQQTRQSIEEIEQITDVKIGVLWPPQAGLGNLTNHKGTIESAIMMAHLDVYKQLGQKPPEELWF